MKIAIDQFRKNIGNIRNLDAICRAIESSTTKALDLSDILRSELVFAVSAFDHFVHEVARLGMLEINQGSRPPTDSYLRFLVPLSDVQIAIGPSANAKWLDDRIREHHGWKSFQQPDKVAEAIRLVSEIRLWDEIASRLGKAPEDIKRQLELIVDRRNKIAHESDMDPSFPGSRWPINRPLVDDAISFIEQIAEAIFDVI